MVSNNNNNGIGYHNNTYRSHLLHDIAINSRKRVNDSSVVSIIDGSNVDINSNSISIKYNVLNDITT